MQTTLSKPTFLMPSHIGGEDPSYFITAGLVFITVRNINLTSSLDARKYAHGPMHSIWFACNTGQVLRCNVCIPLKLFFNSGECRTYVGNDMQIAVKVIALLEPYLWRGWETKGKLIEMLFKFELIAVLSFEKMQRCRQASFTLSRSLVRNTCMTRPSVSWTLWTLELQKAKANRYFPFASI